MCCEKQQHGDGTTVDVLVLQCHAHVKAGDEDEDTALHSAAAEGRTETVLVLVKQCTRNKMNGRLETAARVHYTRLLRPGPPATTTTAAKRFSRLKKLWRTANSTARALLETQCYLNPRQNHNYSSAQLDNWLAFLAPHKRGPFVSVELAAGVGIRHCTVAGEARGFLLLLLLLL